MLSADLGAAISSPPEPVEPAQLPRDAYVEQMPGVESTGTIPIPHGTAVVLQPLPPGDPRWPWAAGPDTIRQGIEAFFGPGSQADGSETLAIDYAQGSELLDQVLKLFENAATWGPSQAGLEGVAANTPAPPPPWIVAELIRENLSPDSLEVIGEVYSESELGLEGPGRPMVHLNGDEAFTMIGSIGAGEGGDYYSIRPGAHGFRLKLTAFDASTNLADLLSVFDQYDGLVISCSVSETENSITIDIRSDGGFHEREVIIRIGPEKSAKSAGLEQYAFTFLPNAPSGDGSDFGSTTGGGGYSPGTGSSDEEPSRASPDPGKSWGGSGWSNLPSPWGSNDGESSQVDATTINVDSAGDGLALGSVALGPIPALSAAPFGGILGFGDAASMLGRHEAAVIDLHLIDLPATGEGTVMGLALEGMSRGRDGLDGGSALPVIAATHPRVSIDLLPGDAPRPEAIPGLDLTGGDAALAASTVEGLSAVRAEDEAAPPENVSPPQRVLRWTVAGLTALMAAHLLLPDLGVLLPLMRPRQRTRRRWLSGSWCRPPRSLG